MSAGNEGHVSARSITSFLESRKKATSPAIDASGSNLPAIGALESRGSSGYEIAVASYVGVLETPRGSYSNSFYIDPMTAPGKDITVFMNERFPMFCIPEKNMISSSFMTFNRFMPRWNIGLSPATYNSLAKGITDKMYGFSKFCVLREEYICDARQKNTNRSVIASMLSIVGTGLVYRNAAQDSVSRKLSLAFGAVSVSSLVLAECFGIFAPDELECDKAAFVQLSDAEKIMARHSMRGLYRCALKKNNLQHTDFDTIYLEKNHGRYTIPERFQNMFGEPIIGSSER